MPIESIEFGVREVMRLGTKIEVLGPKDLRRALTKTLRTLVQRHLMNEPMHSPMRHRAACKRWRLTYDRAEHGRPWAPSQCLILNTCISGWHCIDR
ncbi:WCX domain-containing protein [Metallibacterium sp.]